MGPRDQMSGHCQRLSTLILTARAGEISVDTRQSQIEGNGPLGLPRFCLTL